MQPKLHRYIEKMPRWLVGAARRVEQDYHGDASAIWSDRPSAVELQRRLSEFHGIGQKKAAMAVEILNRDLRVPVDGTWWAATWLSMCTSGASSSGPGSQIGIIATT